MLYSEILCYKTSWGSGKQKQQLNLTRVETLKQFLLNKKMSFCSWVFFLKVYFSKKTQENNEASGGGGEERLKSGPYCTMLTSRRHKSSGCRDLTKLIRPEQNQLNKSQLEKHLVESGNKQKLTLEKRVTFTKSFLYLTVCF